jgi:hypothetical protein
MENPCGAVNCSAEWQAALVYRRREPESRQRAQLLPRAAAGCAHRRRPGRCDGPGEDLGPSVQFSSFYRDVA